MAKFRKKPVVIEAFRMGIDSRPDWFQNRVTQGEITTHIVDGTVNDENPFEGNFTYCLIKTSEGEMMGDYGDYIIKEPFDKERPCYPCKPDIFLKTYDQVLTNNN